MNIVKIIKGIFLLPSMVLILPLTIFATIALAIKGDFEADYIKKLLKKYPTAIFITQSILSVIGWYLLITLFV